MTTTALNALADLIGHAKFVEVNFGISYAHLAEAEDAFNAACKISSPGKDGGQEVEAVARAIDADWWKWADVHYSDEVPGDRLQKQRSLDRAKAAIAAIRPQPASTALVERLAKALEPFAKRAARWDDIPGIYRCHDNVELWQNGNWRCDLTVGDLREARSAIAAAKGESTDANS